MGKFPAYPEYRSSLDQWLGDVPAHWRIVPNKYLSHMTKGKNPSSTEPVSSEGMVAYLSMGYLRGNDDPVFSPIEASSILAESRDILLLWDGSNAGEYIHAKKGIVSSTMALVTVTNADVDRHYYYYLCKAFETELKRHTIGMGIPHVNGEEVKTRIFPVPTEGEQMKIAAFLDHETARIDRLIAKQERLIELLKEKRQAVISHAVTKGLNPNVPMKDSGVEWLGEVPAHWSVCDVKHVTSFITSGPRGWSDYFAEDGDIFLQSGDLVGDLTIDWADTQKVVPPEGAEGTRTALKYGDVLVCITGANTGNVGLVDGLPGRAFINQHLAIVRPLLGKVVPKYLAYCLISRVGRQHFSLVQYGLKEGLSLENVREAVVTLPPLCEQAQIVRHVDEQLRKLDMLHEKSILSITLMKEHRVALVSATVTGKIDVRNWQKPNNEPQAAASAATV